MASRMETFDKCIDELLKAVTCDMLHIENMKSDLNKLALVKISRKKQTELERIRKEAIEKFKTEVKTHIDQKLKEDLNLKDCFEEFENRSLQRRDPWRINGDPQHDTYAQRRHVYTDYMKQLTKTEMELKKELKTLSSSFA